MKLYADSKTLVSDFQGLFTQEDRELGRLVTFVPNKKIPIHNWFPFKEGFSRDFVLRMLREFNANKNSIVLDPFCGVGTTLLTCKEVGINSVGVDSSPLQYFVSKVKVNDYNTSELREHAKEIFSEKFEKPEIGKIDRRLRNFFSIYALEDIVFLKEKIRKIGKKDTRDFFTLALMRSAIDSSFIYRDGAVLRYRERRVMPLRKLFKKRVKRMIKELERAKLSNARAEVYLADSRDLGFLPDNSFDIVITSPPYLTKSEYTKAYSIEYELFLKDEGLEHKYYIGGDENDKETYFRDMEQVLNELHRVTKKNAKLCFVFSEAYIDGEIVPCDLILARLAKESGLGIKKIIPVNQRVVTTEGRIKVGLARESVMIFKRESMR